MAIPADRPTLRELLRRPCGRCGLARWTVRDVWEVQEMVTLVCRGCKHTVFDVEYRPEPAGRLVESGRRGNEPPGK